MCSRGLRYDSRRLLPRYSSEGQRDGYSIEAQERAINEYCKAQGYTVLRFYVDEAQTGTEDDREGFLNMIDAAKAKEFEAIIVHSSTGSPGTATTPPSMVVCLKRQR